MKPQLTIQGYVDRGGVRCPVCLSEDIEGGAIDVEAGGATQGIWCLACHATWTDVYRLQGYIGLETGTA